MKSFLDLSVAATTKFKHLDRVLFHLSPYLTQAESYKILDHMETYANSSLEANWTESDTYMFLQAVLGKDRLLFVETMQRADTALAQAKLARGEL